MKKNVVQSFSLLMLLLIFSCTAKAQNSAPATVPADTFYNVQLKEFNVKAKWKNDTDRYHYNQMKFYVKSILPYMNAATKLFTEVNTKLDDPELSRKERKQYISTREDEMRTNFEDKINSLNVTQGVLLIKLIARQTNVNIYQMLREFKNPITAVKWQTWARFNGLNLDRKYHPEEEGDLELIMDELGYPLPGSYVAQ
jgi:Domain of unknown function (DUF4294)